MRPMSRWGRAKHKRNIRHNMDKKELIANYYTKSAEQMRAYACKVLGNMSDAEDAVQDCFLRLLRMREEIIPASLPALSYRMLRNLLCDHCRWKRAKADAYSYMEQLSLTGDDVESAVSANDLMGHLRQGMSHLPEKCRQVYRLSIEDDKKVSEIALTLDFNYKSTEYCLGKARAYMRSYLRKCMMA